MNSIMNASKEKYVRYGDRPSYLDHTEEIDVLLHGIVEDYFPIKSEGLEYGSIFWAIKEKEIKVTTTYEEFKYFYSTNNYFDEICLYHKGDYIAMETDYIEEYKSMMNVHFHVNVTLNKKIVIDPNYNKNERICNALCRSYNKFKENFFEDLLTQGGNHYPDYRFFIEFLGQHKFNKIVRYMETYHNRFERIRDLYLYDDLLKEYQRKCDYYEDALKCGKCNDRLGYYYHYDPPSDEEEMMKCFPGEYDVMPDGFPGEYVRDEDGYLKRIGAEYLEERKLWVCYRCYKNEEDRRPRTGGASMSAKSISDNNGCANCGNERVCKCKSPNYKMHTPTKQQMCMNCKRLEKCWKCECEDEVDEIKINGKYYYVKKCKFR